MIKKRNHWFIYLVIMSLIALVVLSFAGVFVEDLAGEADRKYRRPAKMIDQTKITKQAKINPLHKIKEVIKPVYRSSEGRSSGPEKRTFEKVEKVKNLFPTDVGEIKNGYIKYKEGVNSVKCDENNKGIVVNVVYGDNPTEQFAAFCYQMFGNYFWTECNADQKVEHKGDGQVVSAGQYGNYICALDDSKKKEYWYYCGGGYPFTYGYEGVAMPDLETNPLTIASKDYYCVDVPYNSKMSCQEDENVFNCDAIISKSDKKIYENLRALIKNPLIIGDEPITNLECGDSMCKMGTEDIEQSRYFCPTDCDSVICGDNLCKDGMENNPESDFYCLNDCLETQYFD